MAKSLLWTWRYAQGWIPPSWERWLDLPVKCLAAEVLCKLQRPRNARAQPWKVPAAVAVIVIIALILVFKGCSNDEPNDFTFEDEPGVTEPAAPVSPEPVTDPEPIEPDNPLLTMPNVIVTPHSAPSTKEAALRVSKMGCENILAVFAGREGVGRVV